MTFSNGSFEYEIQITLISLIIDEYLKRDGLVFRLTMVEGGFAFSPTMIEGGVYI